MIPALMCGLRTAAIAQDVFRNEPKWYRFTLDAKILIRHISFRLFTCFNRLGDHNGNVFVIVDVDGTPPYGFL